MGAVGRQLIATLILIGFVFLLWLGSTLGDAGFIVVWMALLYGIGTGWYLKQQS